MEPAAPNTTTYIIYFHQPVKHAEPDGPSFPMRALITVDNSMDPTTAVNHLYCTGYALYQPFVDSPDYTFKKDANSCAEEIANRYRANYISIEHRYYAFSAPPQCWTNLDDLRAEEAAEDFHNLVVALKKVLKGKWVMSGVSKGGITTLLQHTFHPEDMDIYVPYSAPFFDSDRDTTMQTYWYQNGWNQEFLDMFMAIRQTGISDSTIYNIFYKMTETIELPFTNIENISNLEHYKGKKVLLTIGADWCSNCHALDKQLYATEDFKKAMDNVVLLRYDFTNPDTKESKEAALKFRLVGVPFAAVIDEDQNIVKTFTGGVSLEELNEALKK